MDTDSYSQIFTEDIFEDINNDVKRWFDTSNCDKNDKRPLPIGTNNKVIALRAKTYTYLMNDDSEKKKAKGIKMCNKT